MSDLKSYKSIIFKSLAFTILGFVGMTACLYSWIKFNLASNQAEPFVLKYISFISSISGLAILMSIFYNSGDLGIVLLFGSIVSFFIMVLGYYLKNDEIAKTSRGYFLPIFINKETKEILKTISMLESDIGNIFRKFESNQDLISKKEKLDIKKNLLFIFIF